MITITVKQKEEKNHYIKVEGHAGYAEDGFDIVCASVSCICITSINALISIDEECIVYTEDDGFLEVGVMKHDRVIDILIENMLNLLESLANDYPEYIKILR